MNRNLPVLLSILSLLILPACQANRFAGQWTLEARIDQVASPECSNSFLGRGATLYFELTQEDTALSGFPIPFPGPNVVRDEDADWKVLGEADADQIDIYVWIPNSVTPDGCGDVNHLTGELRDSVVSGVYQGGDCHSSVATDSPNGRIVMEDVNGNPLETCTWSGTFTMKKYEQK